MTGPDTAACAGAVRAFNRFYTAHVGALDEHLLDSPFNLTEARVLYELGQRSGLSAAGLAGTLRLDPAYLSRILRKFSQEGLLERAPNPLGFEIPEKGHYAAGFLYMSPDNDERANEEQIVNDAVEENGLKILGWRDVPVDNHSLGKASAACEPFMRQVFISRSPELEDVMDFERKLYLIRRIIGHRITYKGVEKNSYFYFCSFSSKTMVFK